MEKCREMEKIHFHFPALFPVQRLGYMVKYNIKRHMNSEAVKDIVHKFTGKNCVAGNRYDMAY